MTKPRRNRRRDHTLTPFEAGRAAAADGKPVTSCPHKRAAIKSQDGFIDDVEWRRGWWAGHNAMKRESRKHEDGPRALVTARDSDGHPVEIARDSDDRGTPELRKREKVYRTLVYEKTRFKDAKTGKEREVLEGRSVLRTRDLLGDLHRRGLIQLEWMNAGRRFRRDFEAGQLDPRRAPDIRRAGGGGGGVESEWKLDARDRIGRAMDALGGHGSISGQCAWWCLGCGWTPREWGARKVFGAGRAISEETARGIVISTCEQLHVHYERERLTGEG
jgi:hypothetical protein